MRTRNTFASVAFVLCVASPILGGSLPSPAPTDNFDIEVRISGFQPGTRVRIAAGAVYRMIDPSKAPRGVRFTVTDDMVRYRVLPLHDAVVEVTVPQDGSQVSRTLHFQFTEKLRPAAAGSGLWARVSVPVDLSFTSATTHLMSQPRRLATIPISIDTAASPLNRCLTLDATPDGAVNFHIRADCGH